MEKVKFLVPITRFISDIDEVTKRKYEIERTTLLAKAEAFNKISQLVENLIGDTPEGITVFVDEIVVVVESAHYSIGDAKLRHCRQHISEHNCVKCYKTKKTDRMKYCKELAYKGSASEK